MIRKAHQALVCSIVLSLACAQESVPRGPTGEEQVTDGISASDAGSRVDAGYVQPAPWSALNRMQRFEFMQKVVMPEMTTVFRKVQPDAKISCRTCHGDDAQAVDFEMPNQLAPLNLADFPLDASSDPKIASAAKFMKEEVVPAMAALLDVDLRSAENPMGFGCFSCHARSEGVAPGDGDRDDGPMGP